MTVTSALLIRGKMNPPEIDRDRSVSAMHREWHGCRFACVIECEDPIDAGHIKAIPESEVLHIMVPKARHARPEVIRVQKIG